MRILLVGAVDPWTRSVATIHKYVEWGRILGHDVSVYGYGNPELPRLPFTTDLDGVDVAIFLVQVPSDFPAMPGLARIMDQLPRKKRVVVDLWGRYNETVRLEHDFNHLEKFDSHPAWEWIDAIDAISDMVLQPTLAPRRDDVRSFLFHGFDSGAIARNHVSARDAAATWLQAGRAEKPYGLAYVGSNWQRWTQVRRLLEDYRDVRDRVGQFCLAGWDWSQRPAWAVEMGLKGIDTDPELLADLGVEIRQGIRFDQIVDLVTQGRFAPILHRPLFRDLGLVTNRSFETFYADSIPILMLPEDFVESIYGRAALKLVPGEHLAAHLSAVMDDPEPYWDALLKTRQHLAEAHSYRNRFGQLERLLADREACGAAP
jgi:hypothetical protein